jgi:hypothetical protein
VCIVDMCIDGLFLFIIYVKLKFSEPLNQLNLKYFYFDFSPPIKVFERL